MWWWLDVALLVVLLTRGARGQPAVTIHTPYMPVKTIAGQPVSTGTLDGTGAGAKLFGPNGADFDAAGNCYSADWLGNRIRKITPAGVVTTVAGGGAPASGTTVTSGASFGAGINALFYNPMGLGVDSNGVIHLASTTSCNIAKVTAAGVSTLFAGGGSTGLLCGFSDATGSAALFQKPSWVTLDAANTAFVADSGNNRIRKVSTAGVVTTLAGGATGTEAGFADGTGTVAMFSSPESCAVDASGNVYVGDRNNHRVRKITAAGVVTTLAGATSGCKDDVATLALFNQPRGVAIDNNAPGVVYVVDTMNNKLRRISPLGKVTTIAGGGINTGTSAGVAAGTTAGLVGVGVTASGTNALFNQPYGLAFDRNSNACINDNVNQLVRYIVNPTPSPLTGSAQVLADGTAYKCPPNACSCIVSLAVIGGGGGGGVTNTGGLGASITLSLSLSAAGPVAYFVTNFGSGGAKGTKGGGGGAASSITSIIAGVETLLAVAGGGGGGASTSGGAGGPVGGNGGTASGTGGQNGGAGGSQTTAGAGGTGTFAGIPATGGGSWTSPGVGGTSAGCTAGCVGAIAWAPGWNAAGGFAGLDGFAAGGGGGGWYGGGGGSYGTVGVGGGGGSSWVNPAYITVSGVGVTPTSGTPGYSSSSTAGTGGGVAVLSVFVVPTCSPLMSTSSSASPSRCVTATVSRTASQSASPCRSTTITTRRSSTPLSSVSHIPSRTSALSLTRSTPVTASPLPTVTRTSSVSVTRSLSVCPSRTNVANTGSPLLSLAGTQRPTDSVNPSRCTTTSPRPCGSGSRSLSGSGPPSASVPRSPSVLTSTSAGATIIGSTQLPVASLPPACAAPAGSFCDAAAGGAITLCPLGTYGATAGLTSATCSGLCSSGFFGDTAGLTSPTCTNACAAGHFCPAGSTSWKALNCGQGSYCPEGSAAPIACPPRGSFDVAAGGVSNGPAWLVETAACRAHCFNGGVGQLSTC